MIEVPQTDCNALIMTLLEAAAPLHGKFRPEDIEDALMMAGFALKQDRLGTDAACNDLSAKMLNATIHPLPPEYLVRRPSLR